MRFLSPLRYPGGKVKMAPFLSTLIADQAIRPTVYAEPYAGGAGAALHLLVCGAVDRLALNDLNPGVAAFWRAVFFETEALVERVREATPTLEEWAVQRAIYLDPHAEPFDRGFATFFLNRTNRSGILSARPIGGLEQNGTWKLDARYHSDKLAARIEFLGTLADRVDVSEQDGSEFIEALDRGPEPTLFYVDPPYLKQGEELYLADMQYTDHVKLSTVLHTVTAPWVLTYDRDDRVHQDLYAQMSCAAFTVSHTAAKQHVGGEYLVVPQHVRVTSLKGFGPRAGSWLTGRAPAEELA